MEKIDVLALFMKDVKNGSDDEADEFEMALMLRNSCEFIALLDLSAEEAFPKRLREALNLPTGILHYFKTIAGFLIAEDIEGLADWSYRIDFVTPTVDQKNRSLYAAHVNILQRYMVQTYSQVELALFYYHYARRALAEDSRADEKTKKTYRNLMSGKALPSLQETYRQLGLDMSVFTNQQRKKGFFWNRW